MKENLRLGIKYKNETKKLYLKRIPSDHFPSGSFQQTGSLNSKMNHSKPHKPLPEKAQRWPTLGLKKQKKAKK